MVSDSRTIKEVAFSGTRNPRVKHRHLYRPLEIIKTALCTFLERGDKEYNFVKFYSH